MLTRRGIIPRLLFAGCVTFVMGQPGAWANDPPPVISANGGEQARAPINAAKWPFKFGKHMFSKPDETKDPFLTEGAAAQHVLARQLAPVAAPVPPAFGPAPQTGANPMNQGAQYPWPAPVDTRPAAAARVEAAPSMPRIPQSTTTTWGNSAVSYEDELPADPQSAAVQQVQNLATTAAASVQRASGAVDMPGQYPTPSTAATNPHAPPSYSSFAPAPAAYPRQAPVGAQAAQTATSQHSASPQPAYPAPRFSPDVRGTDLMSAQAGATPATLPATALSAGPPTAPPPGYGAPPLPSGIASGARESDFVPAGPQAAPASSAVAAAVQSSAASPAAARPSAAQRVGPIDQSIWGTTFARSNEAQPPPGTPAAETANNDAGQDALTRTASGSANRQTGFTGVQPPFGVARTSAAPSAVPAGNKDAFAIGTSIPKNPRVALLESPTLQSQTVPVAQPVIDARGTVEEGTDVLAVVGNQSILKGDVLGQVNEQLAPYRESVSEAELAAQREKIINELLPRLVEQKLIVFDFLKQIPVEKLPELEKVVYENYNEKQLPEILAKTGLKSAAELDAKLRELGSSLATQQQMFFERMLAAEAVNRQVPRDAEISHEEMLSYYNAHLQDYAFPSKVRWEQLMVRKDQFASWQQAYNALAEMGNTVKRGVPFEEVSQQSSQGPRASSGGQYDWTSQGSLVSKELDRVLFSIKPGELSKIISDDESYHIVRVKERVVAGRQPFMAVQAEIKKKLQEDRFRAGVEQYVERLRRETIVWTRGQGDVVPSQYVAP